MRSISTISVLMALVTAAIATTGPCQIQDYTCNPVMDASGCYNAIILGWDGASKNPADIFKCVDPPELVSTFFHFSGRASLSKTGHYECGGNIDPALNGQRLTKYVSQMCSCYGCTDGLDELVNKYHLCPYNGTSTSRFLRRTRINLPKPGSK
ncbi:hypothetical protein F4679DRAFT_594025 [Xylaria curta]|nr:hypothetical protein F4679DRAFT_594025 [Xylaria curta]